MGRSFKICAWLLASSVLHMWIALILVHRDSPPENAKQVDTSSQVKFRVLPTAPQLPAVETASPAKVVTPSKKSAERSKPRPAKMTLRYDQLFPKLGVDYQIAVADEEEPGSRTFDPENDIPFAAKVRHLSKVTAFARDLAEMVAIPVALRKIQASGAARVRFSRKDQAGWKVSEAVGDPYFRALLYETLSGMSPETYGLVMLSASEFESIRVVFDYRTISVVDHATKPVDVRVDGNKIFIVVTRQDMDPKWQMLAASPAGIPSVNLLGVGMVLARPYIESDPHSDVEIQRLRLSPAFARPIGR